MIEDQTLSPGSANSVDACRTTVGEAVIRLLEHWGVSTAFGVISIHNMPMLDPLGMRGHIRFVTARGEAGATNMADAYARVSGGLGVVFTSTGTAAGNAAGALVEAITAGSPVLHITGQVPSAHLDKGRAYIHEAPAQLDMLRAISKAAFRIDHPEELVATLTEAAEAALSAPTGPVSVEIPIDVQWAELLLPDELPHLRPIVSPAPADALAELIDRFVVARRPVLLLGGGARGAEAEAIKLGDHGVGIVTSTNGRGIVPESHPMSLGAFNCYRETEEVYANADLLIVAGSRLRGNETLNYGLRLPEQVVVVDCDPNADGRCYDNSLFVEGGVKEVLAALAERIASVSIDPDFAATIADARARMHGRIRRDLGPYVGLVDALQARLGPDAAWVRDVTISNSMWGNRYLHIENSRAGVHAVGGGIGQGLPMAIGAALAADGGAIALTGDGGLSLCLGELATLADEKADVVLILMNDQGYGVIRNIQDAEYGGRRMFTDILAPDFAMISASIGLPHRRVASVNEFREALDGAVAAKGPSIIEVDMLAIGPYPARFAGPPKAVV